jgi:hypothetical protein
MKKLLLVLLLLTIVPSFSFGQKNITLGVFGGVIIPTGTFADGFNLSPTVGVESYYPVDKNIDVVADIAYSFLSLKNPGNLISNDKYYYLESSGGIRLNLMPVKQKFFIEALVGGYTFGVNYTINGITYTNSTTNFGLNAGAGVIVPLSAQIEIAAKVKFHYIFTPVNSTSYIGFTGGFNYKFL